MKKIHTGQVLVCRSVLGLSQVMFYQVVRCTSRTCEIRELRKKIISQIENEQEVEPIRDEFVSKKIRRKILENGAVKIGENLFAWPWEGRPHWQATLIFIP